MNTSLALCFQLPGTDQASLLPTAVMLIPAGEFSGRDNRTWRNPNPEQVIADTAAQAKGLDLVFDVEHSTELKAPNGDPAPAVGWIALSSLRVENGAIFGSVEWNELGKGYLADKQMRYYSPAFTFDADGVVKLISSVGLTNKANLPQTPALNNQQPTHVEKPMKALLAKLGLADDASEDQAIAAVDKINSDHQLALNSQQSQPDLSKFVPMETHQLALNRALVAEQTVADNIQAALDEQAEVLVDAAIADGKVAPANRDQYLALCRVDGGLDQVKSLLSSAPAVILPEQPPTKLPANGGELNEDQLAICRQLDISHDDYARHLPATA